MDGIPAVRVEPVSNQSPFVFATGIQRPFLKPGVNRDFLNFSFHHNSINFLLLKLLQCQFFFLTSSPHLREFSVVSFSLSAVHLILKNKED